MIQTLTINVTVPDGYEATGEYRKPLPMEWWLTNNGQPHFSPATDHVALNNNRIILRKKWALPDWFRPEWVLEHYTCLNTYGVRRLGQAPSFSADALWALHDDVFTAPPAGTQLPICKK